MTALLVLVWFSVYLYISVSQNPFDLTNKNGDIIIGQYLVFFDTACLAAANHDVIGEFLDLFTCYNFNVHSVDLYPHIGDHFIVVNKDPLCHSNDNTHIEFGYFCINSIEQDAWGTADSSECICESRNVNPFVFHNLDSLTPQIDSGFEFVQCVAGYDPGFDIIVMDSGIEARHSEFDGIIYERIFDAYPGDPLDFHGTFVAGIVLGQNYGVTTPQNTRVKLLDVRMLGEFGGAEACDFVNGYKAIIDYLQKNPKRKAIINLSIRWENCPAFDKLLALIKQNGGIMFASAGNFAVQSCLQSPSSSADTFSVGSVDINFDKSWFSNFGSCVNIWAPGENITSATVGGGSLSGLSGTSFAAPLVSGVAANILMANPQLNVDDIRRALLSLLNGAEYDVNFERPDIDPEYTTFPRYRAPVLNQPRVQGTCEIYGFNEMVKINRYAYSGNNGYGYNENNVRGYDDGYRINEYDKTRPGYAKKRYRKYGYNRYNYGQNNYEQNRNGDNTYRGYEYGNRYQKNEYEEKRYQRKGRGNNRYDNSGYEYRG